MDKLKRIAQVLVFALLAGQATSTQCSGRNWMPSLRMLAAIGVGSASTVSLYEHESIRDGVIDLLERRERREMRPARIEIGGMIIQPGSNLDFSIIEISVAKIKAMKFFDGFQLAFPRDGQSSGDDLWRVPDLEDTLRRNLPYSEGSALIDNDSLVANPDNRGFVILHGSLETIRKQWRDRQERRQ